MPALLFEVRDDVAYLTLNRPEVHNAINSELMVQLAEAWKRVAADDSIRVVILTGAARHVKYLLQCDGAAADRRSDWRIYEARRLRLISHVVPAGQVIAKAEEIARKIAANEPLAVRAIKQRVTRTSGLPLEKGLKIENEIARGLFSSEDAREGPRAFIEKRKPNFKGK